MSAPPQIVETITLDGITFERYVDGREIAYREADIIGDIIPDGDGNGGWVYRLCGDVHGRDRPHHVSSRAQGRVLLAGFATT